MPHAKSDVVVIGAGPVGLFSIFACGMQKLRCHIVDALPHIGGQCSALYPEKPIYDIPAFSHIAAADLIENLREQAAPFDPIFHLNQQVNSLEKHEDGFTLTTSAGTQLRTRAIIIAAGVGAFGPNRPPLVGLEYFEEKSVFYSVPNKMQFSGKNVLIAGGGDSAVDWALNLMDTAASISLLHRRPKFRALPESVERLNQAVSEGRINLVVPYQLAGLEGIDGQLTHVMIEDLDGNKRSLEADVLLPFYGLSMNLGPINEWGLALDQHHIIVDPSNCQTNCPGIFAIGDIARYPGKLKLILTGFSEAALAAHSAREWLYPDEVRHFEYSTTMGVPQI